MKKLFFLMILSCSSIMGFAQSELTISNPKVEAFTVFEDYPVSHMTGVPDITIPLFSVESQGYSLPITLRYHLGSVKPPFDNTNVAVGWILEAGGHIIQSVKHTSDINGRPSASEWIDAVDLNSEQSTKANFTTYPNDSKGFCPERRYIVDWFNKNFDTEYDIYSFTFPGGSGEFILEEDQGTWTPYFLSDRGMKGAYNSGSQTIDIINPNGYRFYYGDRNHLLIPQSSSKGFKYDLTNIYSPHGVDLFQFSYLDHDRGFGTRSVLLNHSIDDRFEILKCNTLGPPESWDFQTSTFNSFVSTQTGVERVIDEITFANGSIKFDVTAAAINKITLKNASGSILKEVVFQTGNFPGSAAYRRLDYVVITDAVQNEVKKYYFDYYGKTTAIEDGHIGVDEFGYFDGTSSSSSNSNVDMNTRTITKDESNWSNCNYYGFVTNSHTFGSFRSPPSFDDLKTYVIKEIVYPTGGKTEFEYGINRYIDPYNGSENNGGGLRVEKITAYTNTGAIAKVKEYEYQPGSIKFSLKDPKNFISTNQTLLYYVTPTYGSQAYMFRSRTLYNSLIPRLLGQNTVYYTNVTEYEGTTTNNIGKTEFEYGYFHGDDFAYFGSEEDPYLSLSNRKGWENGKLIRKSVFANGGATPVFEEQYSYSRPVTRTFKNLHIYKVNTHGEIGSMPADITEQFQEFDWMYYDLNISETGEYLPVLAYEYNIVAGALHLTSKTSTQFFEDGTSHTNSQTYQYPVDLDTQPFTKRITTVRSDGDSYIQSFKYPADYPSGTQMTTTTFNRMISDNVIGNPVIEETSINGTQTIKSTISNWEIDTYNNLVLDNIQELDHSNSQYDVRFDYNKYNNDGVVEQLTNSQGIVISYHWGFSNNYPIVKAENIDYSTLESAVTTAMGSVAGYSTINDLMSALVGKMHGGTGNLRNTWDTFNAALRSISNLESALISTYTYDPVIGMTSQTDPTGVTTYYDYDNFGRLESIQDHSGDMVKVYEYHYVPPPGISVSNSSLLLGTNGGTEFISLYSDVAWTRTISYDDPGVTGWLGASPASGSGNATLEVTISPNSSTSTRSGTVIISDNSGTGLPSQNIRVSQDGVPAYITVSPTEMRFTSLSSKPFNISSNTDWTIEIVYYDAAEQDWIDGLSAIQGSGDRNNIFVRINTLPPSGDMWEAQIRISDGKGKVATIDVSIDNT
ncbi:MAG: hypothetical protein MI975_08295 [Cytophagales bacterium]|nr:hypothetical protein [Cytophagales bacterium]